MLPMCVWFCRSLWALTQDGEGEVVGGLVMMLKGANSNDVIVRVKERMAEIQKSLPEGLSFSLYWIEVSL